MQLSAFVSQINTRLSELNNELVNSPRLLDRLSMSSMGLPQQTQENCLKRVAAVSTDPPDDTDGPAPVPAMSLDSGCQTILNSPSSRYRLQKRRIRTVVSTDIISLKESRKNVHRTVLKDCSEECGQSESNGENNNNAFESTSGLDSNQEIVMRNKIQRWNTLNNNSLSLNNHESGSLNRNSVIGCPGNPDATKSHLGVGVVKETTQCLEFESKSTSNIPLDSQVPFNNKVDLLKPRRNTLVGLNKFELKRRAILIELFEAEQSYVHSLKTLVMVYYLPLRKKKVIAEQNINIIFYKIPEIHVHHQLLLHSYRKRLENWQPSTCIGDVFVQTFSKPSITKTYTDFIGNFLQCQQTLRITRISTPFARFLEQQAKLDKKKYRIEDLLIQPVQRIPRYELFMRDLQKCTPMDHEDHGLLEKARDCVHELAVEIDNAKDDLSSAAETDIYQLKGIMDNGENSPLKVVADESSLPTTSSEEDENMMQCAVKFRMPKESKVKDGQLFVHCGRIALMYRKRRSVFLQKTTAEDECSTSYLRPSVRKQYIRKFETNLSSVEAYDSNADFMAEWMSKLAGARDSLILQQIEELCKSLGDPCEILHKEVHKAIEMKSSNANMTQQKLRQLNEDASELRLATKDKNELMVILWFSDPEEKMKWLQIINDESYLKAHDVNLTM